MKTLRYLSSICARRLPNIPTKSKILISFQFSSSPSSSTSVSNPLLNYLTVDLNLPGNRALSIASRFSFVELLEKPKAVVLYLRSLGLTDSEIASSVLGSPQILFSKIEKTLKPKIKLFQDLGLVGPHLGPFLAKNSSLLPYSIHKCLIPNIQLAKKLLGNDDNPKDLITIISRCNQIATKNHLKLSNNIKFLQSCGVVGPQLAMLLKRQPRVFVLHESRLRDLVSDVLEMGFSTDSGMFVYGLLCVSSLSKATFRRKLDIFVSIGISERDCLDMFRRAPYLFRASDDKIKKGIDFFLNTAKLDAKVLFAKPTLLMHSFERKVIPRYRVLQVLKAKKLLKKEPRFTWVLDLTEAEFLEKFLLKFEQDFDQLSMAYMAHRSDCSSEIELNKSL